MAFVKLHEAILDSSVWLESHTTRIVWITMLAMAKRDGVVEASIGGLASRAHVTRDECVQALQVLTGPDQDSRDGTTGERVEDVPGGWLILNHAQHRDRQTNAQLATAERVRRHRARKKEACNDVTLCNGLSRSETVGNDLSLSEAEAEAEAKKKRVLRNTPKEKDLGSDDPLMATDEWIIEEWNKLPDVTHTNGSLLPETKKRVAARIAKHRQKAWWQEEFFARVKRSDFLRGKTKADFVANLGWAMGPVNINKILEDRYKNKIARVNLNY